MINNNFISHERMKGGAVRIALDLPYKNALNHFKAAFYKPIDASANPHFNIRVQKFSLGILLLIPVINIVVDLALRIFCVNTKSVAVETYGSGTSTTFHPEHSTLEQDKAGIIDFAHVFSEFGIAYISDTTGHGKAGKRAILEPLWNKFNQDFINDYKSEFSKLVNRKKIQEFMKKHFLNLNREIENAGTASTFSLAILIEINEKKFLASCHVGDSTLLHVTQNGTINHLTNVDPLELSSININSPIQFNFTEVQSGDKVFGLTDGVTDFLTQENLHAILLDEATNKNNLLEKIEDAIVNPKTKENVSKDIKEYDPKEKNGSDDISAFVMVV